MYLTPAGISTAEALKEAFDASERVNGDESTFVLCLLMITVLSWRYYFVFIVI